MKRSSFKHFLVLKNICAWQSMERDHLNKLSVTFQQYDQCENWWTLAKWFLKDHDFIHVNSTVAGKCNKHKQDGGHPGFPIRTILATVDHEVTSILPLNFESIALLVQEKKFKIDFRDGRHGRHISYQNDLSYFWSTSHLDASYQVSSQLAFRFRRKSEK